MITLIHRNENKADDSVISMSKIRSIEYMALKMTTNILKKSIDANELERYSENITQQYIRQLKAISKHVEDKMPHPETFYLDIFTTALQCANKRQQ